MVFAEMKSNPLVPGLLFLLTATVIISVPGDKTSVLELGNRLMTLAGTVPCLVFLAFGRSDS